MNTKKCTKCGEIKYATPEFFHRSKDGKYGLYPSCKTCVSNRLKKYHTDNRSKLLERARVYRSDNKVNILTKQKDYRSENKDVIAKRKKDYYVANKSIIANRHRDYYAVSKDKIRVHNRLPYKYTSALATRLFADKTKKCEDGNLQVRCKHKGCNQWFSPAKWSVQIRLAAINGKTTIGAENHFYCSVQCKAACILYKATPDSLIKIDRIQAGVNIDHADYYSPGDLYTWANQVKATAHNACEICGSTEGLQAHHIEPKSIAPEIALDPANGVCLCSSCHMAYGHSDNNCRTTNLRKCAV